MAMNCSVTSQRKATMSWKKNGIDLFPKQNSIYTEVIAWKNVSEKDSGNYTCFASDSKHLKPKSVSMELKVPNNGELFKMFI